METLTPSMEEDEPAPLSLTPITRSLNSAVESRSLVQRTAETDSAPEATPASALKLPFDPLRLIDALVRRWLMMLLVGGACAGVMMGIGLVRFETLHTAKAQLIKQELVAFRQSETGETFKPNDLSLPTLTSMMYSGAVTAKACELLAQKYDEHALRAGLIVVPERNTNLLNLSMTTNRSPEAALDMLGGYINAVLDVSRDMQREEATSMKKFLQLQIDRTERDLMKVNEELLAYGREAQLIDADKQMDAWLGELGNFSLKYETLKLDHETLDVRIQGVERELAKVDTNAARMDNARRELAELRVRYTDEHPAVQESRDKLAAMQKEMSTTTTRVDSPRSQARATWRRACTSNSCACARRRR